MKVSKSDVLKMKKLARTFIGSAPVEKVCVIGPGKIYASDGNAVLEASAEFSEPVWLSVPLEHLDDVEGLDADSLARANPPKIAMHVYSRTVEVEGLASLLNAVKVVIYPALDSNVHIKLVSRKMLLAVEVYEGVFGVRIPVQTDAEFAGCFPYATLAHIRKVMEQLDAENAQLLLDGSQFAVRFADCTVHVPVLNSKLSFKNASLKGFARLPAQFSAARLRSVNGTVRFNGEQVGECQDEFAVPFKPDVLAKLAGSGELDILTSDEWVILSAGRIFYATRRRLHG